ncbi:MAG: alpha/beta fold hydrolase, partial [Planctomycetes bacterium]|nr:alpha/beta fold hydrolase [Planctomycetota bacterium]
MASNTTPKSFVLVHGAYHGGWCWKRVADVLRSRGHSVTTPTQTGVGERSHLLSESVTLSVFIDDIVNHLTWENLTSVVLVGHSFGGITITGVADAVPERLSKLIYLDAVILENGEALFDVF